MSLSPFDRLLAERPYFRGNLKSILPTAIRLRATWLGS